MQNGGYVPGSDPTTDSVVTEPLFGAPRRSQPCSALGAPKRLPRDAESVHSTSGPERGPTGGRGTFRLGLTQARWRWDGIQRQTESA